MCKVKDGSTITTNADLQNLVTSIVLRQETPFTKEEVFNEAIEKLAVSPLLSEDSCQEVLRKMCDRTIKYIELSNGLRSVGKNQYRLTLPFPSYNRSMA